jgi:SHS2 domain-containing protein
MVFCTNGGGKKFVFIWLFGYTGSMTDKKIGFEEIEHTADWALRVWAPDLETLFATAAEGMSSLSGIELSTEADVKSLVQLDAQDMETLLVDFLSEILFAGEDEGVGFDSFDIAIKNGKLTGILGGGKIKNQEKQIKAVTFHNLRIDKTEMGFEVLIVFDV